MDPDMKKRWVDALRSGKYQQGQGTLRTMDDRYCCIGVLCDVAGMKWRTYGGFWEADENLGALTDKDNERLGLGFAEGILIGMNDEGRTFSEIADYIEENL